MTVGSTWSAVARGLQAMRPEDNDQAAHYDCTNTLGRNKDGGSRNGHCFIPQQRHGHSEANVENLCLRHLHYLPGTLRKSKREAQKTASLHPPQPSKICRYLLEAKTARPLHGCKSCHRYWRFKTACLGQAGRSRSLSGKAGRVEG